MNKNIFSIGELKLVNGVGDYSKAEACIMSAAAMIKAIEDGSPLEKATDELECACPVIRALCIRRNDGKWDSDEQRSSWGRRLIPRIIGSRKSGEETIQRAFRCADVAIHEILPLALPNLNYSEIPRVTDKESAIAARDLVRSAAYTADAAAAAADAAADAAAYTAADDAAAYTAAAAAARAARTARTAHAAADAAYAADTYAAADAAAWSIIENLIEEFLEIDSKPLSQLEQRSMELTFAVNEPG